MLAAGPAGRQYDPTLKPVMSLVRQLAARTDLAHVAVQKPGFKLELRRNTPRATATVAKAE
jgi:oxaloacetate decarboxylase (Na+ extruding) subunit alpha